MRKFWKTPVFWVSAGISLAVAGLIAYGTAQLVLQAQRQQFVQFVDVEPVEPNRFFTDAPEPPTEIRETMVANTPGWVVNKGPIRVTSAYKNLFGKQALIDIAEWIYRDLPWGANGLSLTNLTFTTGTDSKTIGTVLGYHTSGREGSGIYISPDAFETVKGVSSRIFNDLSYEAANNSRRLFQEAATKFVAANPFTTATSAAQDQNFTAQLNQQVLPYVEPAKTETDPTTPLLTYYQPLSAKQIQNIFFNPKGINGSSFARIYQNDDFFANWEYRSELFAKKYLASPSDTNATQVLVTARQAAWQRVYNGNYLAPGTPGDLTRLMIARAQNKVADLVRATIPRYAFDTAVGLINAATANPQGENWATNYWNWFLFATLPDVIFAADAATSGRHELRPLVEWDQAWAQVKKAMSSRGGEDTLLPKQEASYQLFKTYYAYALDYYTKFFAPPNAALVTFGASVVDDNLSINSYYRKFVANVPAPARISFFLANQAPEGPTLTVTKEDLALGLINPAELTTTPDLKLVLTHATSFTFRNALKWFLEDNALLPHGVSLREFYRSELLNAMRYTIAHEYGHHETMWQAFGTYAATHEIYSPEYAAFNAMKINATLFNRLDAIAKTTAGLKNAVDIMKRSGDKYSGTWTPTYMYYDQHNFVGPAFDEAGQPISAATWRAPELNDFYTTIPDPYDPFLIQYVQDGLLPPITVERGLDYFETETGGDVMGKHSRYLFVLDPEQAKVNGKVVVGARQYLANEKFNGNPLSKGTPFRNSYSLGELLWAYQLSIWSQTPKDNTWEWAHGFRLPRIGEKYPAVLTRKGTVRYAQRYYLYGLETPLYDKLGFQGFYSTADERNAIIAALDDLVDRYYDEVVAQYPNFFEATATLPAMSFYERELIAAAMTMRATRAALAGHQVRADTDYDALVSAKPGAYFDPALQIYQKAQNLLDENELWQKFGEKETLVTEGTVAVGRAKYEQADYTGSYSEFLTRAWNQFTYRPNMRTHLEIASTPTTTIDWERYLSAEVGWIEDSARFVAQGTPFYRYNLADPSNTKLTEEGGRLLMWFREMLGLGSSLDLLKPLPRDAAGEIDLAALDASLVRRNTFEKIYRSNTTERLTAWGWFTPAEAAKYKYLVLRHADGTSNYVPLKANAHTSNYFYYADMTSKTRRALVPNYVQWVADPFIYGKYANATLKLGTTEVYFTDVVGGELVTLASTADDDVQIRHNNDNEELITEVVLTVTSAASGTRPRVILTTQAL